MASHQAWGLSSGHMQFVPQHWSDQTLIGLDEAQELPQSTAVVSSFHHSVTGLIITAQLGPPSLELPGCRSSAHTAVVAKIPHGMPAEKAVLRAAQAPRGQV